MAVLKNKQWRLVSKYHQSARPVCLLGGKGKNESGGGDEVRDLSACPSAGYYKILELYMLQLCSLKMYWKFHVGN